MFFFLASEQSALRFLYVTACSGLLTTVWLLDSIVWRCSHRVSLQMRKLRLAWPLCLGAQAWDEMAATVSSFLPFIVPASLPD